MGCTHPVLYVKEGGLYCHVCGALVRSDTPDDKREGQTETIAETPKKAIKRKAKTTVD